MSINLNNLLKKVDSQGETIYLRETDPNVGTKDFWCSTYLACKRVLIRGEFNNPKAGSRKAIIILTDPKTGKLKGWLTFFDDFDSEKLTFRTRNDVEFKKCSLGPSR